MLISKPTCTSCQVKESRAKELAAFEAVSLDSETNIEQIILWIIISTDIALPYRSYIILHLH